MRILFVSQVYVPDMAANAILCGSLSRYLVGQGHRVSVVAGPPMDTRDTDSRAAQLPPGLSIHRSTGNYTTRRGIVNRLLSFTRLYWGFALHVVRHRDYDVIVVLTTPPMIYLVGLIAKFLIGAKIVLWSMDCYPEVAVEAGVLRRNGAVHKVLAAVNRRFLRRVDAVVALDEDMAGRLGGAGAERVRVIHNWESDEAYRAVTPEERSTIRRQLGVRDTDIVVMYLGNMGMVHEFDTVLAAIERLGRSAPMLKFVFVGGGVMRPRIEEACRDSPLSRVIFRDFIPKARTRIALGACDLGLLTIRREMVGLVTPSKVYGYLAMGVPLLYVGPHESEVGRIIGKAGCGKVFENEQVAALSEYLLELPGRQGDLRTEGLRGRAHFVEHFEAKTSFAKFDSLFAELRRPHARPSSRSE